MDTMLIAKISYFAVSALMALTVLTTVVAVRREWAHSRLHGTSFLKPLALGIAGSATMIAVITFAYWLIVSGVAAKAFGA